jgi:aminotransferase
MSMSFLAERTKVQASATLALSEKVKELKRAGQDVISLSLGEPDFLTPEHVRNYAKQALDEGYTFYPDSAGLIELREAIAHKFQHDNRINVDPKKNVVVTVGGKEAIYLAMMATVNPGDEVIVPNPCWVSYVPCIELAGGKPVYLPLKAKEDFRLSAERLENAITNKTKMIIINSPNNPSGTIINRSDLETIADLAKRKKFLVVSDELYEKIIFDGEKHVSIASLDGMEDFTITVNGFSKAFAMTGWRLGYFAAPTKIAERMVALHGHIVTGACSFMQRAAALAMRDPRTEKSITEMTAEYLKRRNFVINELSKITNIVRPKGTFYAFPDISKYGLTSEKFSLELLERAKVAVVPGDSFGPSGEGFVRMSFATSMENLEKAFSRMKPAIATIQA